MSEFSSELDPDDFVGEPPAGDASPDEFMSNDQSVLVSEETGTVYEPTGEPAATPLDQKRLAEESDAAEDTADAEVAEVGPDPEEDA
jgi:hypothetical protein